MFCLNSISKSAMANAEVERIIKELKSGELEMRNVPEEFALNSDVVKAERKLGLRKSGRRGFDVISQLFFVEEEWFSKNLVGALIPIQYKKTFASFAQYYEFLDGDIYENACYYQYAFEDEFSKNLDLDINRLTKASSFITDTL